ncbi:hypothetical protein IKN40_06320, partial [bacterium]|nr:hypothetical protein [bacterium]
MLLDLQTLILQYTLLFSAEPSIVNVALLTTSIILSVAHSAFILYQFTTSVIDLFKVIIVSILASFT